MKIVREISPSNFVIRKIQWDKGVKVFHWHDKIELVVALDHSFGVLVDGEWHEAKKGDVIVIGENIVHSFRIDADNTNAYLAQFPYRILLGGGIVPHGITPVISREEIEKDESFLRCIDNIISVIFEEQKLTRVDSDPFLQCMFGAFYFLLAKKFSLSAVGNSEKKEKQDFYKIASYANEHFTDDITVQSIARSIYMDRGRLSRIFSKYSGTNLKDYINSLRVARAAQLIKSGMSITEAAFESGFQSVRTFNEVYKKIMNTNPTQLLKSKD